MRQQKDSDDRLTGSSADNRVRRDGGNDGQRRSAKSLVICPVVQDTRSGSSATQSAHITATDALKHVPKRDNRSRLEEAVGLAAAIDLDIVNAQLVSLNRPRPSTLIGSGKVDEIKSLVSSGDIELVFVDSVLSPVQQRNLERAWSCKVLDRTGLILEIFGARAQTREGRLQVELAHLQYQKSRLVRSWTHLERQRGGFGFLGGPGETQIEADRRMIQARIAKIERLLAKVRQTRDLHRKSRKRVPYPVIALVGYTNAGKSTLFNRLTDARVDAKDLLFATLDPTLRAMTLPAGRKVILSDTVGFVSDLPHELVAAFHATLEEVIEADLIVHVRDISHPDSEAQSNDVADVLREIGIAAEAGIEDSVIVEAWNKADRLDEEKRIQIQNLAGRTDNVVMISALSGEGLDRLLALIEARISTGEELHELKLSGGKGREINWLYEHCDVFERRDEKDGGVTLSVRVPKLRHGQFIRKFHSICSWPHDQ